jgi:hypothetical protein
MPFIAYKDINFRPASLAVIEHANEIINAYAAQGLTLTLRQLYYQFVSRDLIPNNQREYKKLGDVIGNARQAGMIDWYAIVDRSRSLRGTSFWQSPDQIISAAANGYRTDRWDLSQAYHVEVWVEKEALVDVIGRAAQRWDLNYFACKGYTSESAMWSAARRLIRKEDADKETIILHLGDHDPSGIDMTRDIQDRLRGFGSTATVTRLALNMDQVDEYNPPPNPAKMTDSRAEGYVDAYGTESWELDALDPALLDTVIRDAVEPYVDMPAWRAATADWELELEALRKIERNWDAVKAYVEDLDEDA